MRNLEWKRSVASTTLLVTCAMGCAIESGVESGEAAATRIEALPADRVYTFRGVDSGKCLDVENGSTANGANIRLWSCNGATAQQFRVEVVSGSYVQLRNVASNKCADVWGRSTENGANIAQWDCHGGTNQQFSIDDVGGGAVRIVSRSSGQALDAWNWGTSDGTNIAQWPVTGGANQHFTPTEQGSGGGGGGGAGGTCTNVRPTGTEWDAATCDDWATHTNECSAGWMIDNGYCNESCGRCSSGGGGGGGGGNTGTPGNLPRFVGNITTRDQVDYNGLRYANYWDQITPENAGKWGSVQSTPSSGFNWSTLDAIYDYAQDNDIIFKQHAFVWGAQQPNGVPTQNQVINWIRSFCQRYPDTRLIDVVNEPPPHTEPNYANNIGGGTNGNWQWITNSFKWARQYCPNAVLILNDYNTIEWSGDNQNIIDIANTVLANGGPIDALGAQAHGLGSSHLTPQTVSNFLNKLHNDTGLPVYITELDLDYANDQQQLSAYQQYFPLFRNASFVPGITLWGWIHGTTWIPNSGLVRGTTPRPAMTWLMNQLGRPSP